MFNFSVICINYATNSVERDNIDSFDAALELFDHRCGEGHWSVVYLRNNITNEDLAIMEYEDPDEFEALIEDCDDGECANEKQEADARKKWNVHAETDASIHEFWFAEWDDAQRCYEGLKANKRTISGHIASGETGELFAHFSCTEDDCSRSYSEWASKECSRWS